MHGALSRACLQISAAARASAATERVTGQQGKTLATLHHVAPIHNR
jgi:hypothetical protein